MTNQNQNTALAQYNNDGIEIYIDTTTGESFASQRGYSRMAKISEKAVRERLKGANQNQVKTVKIPTSGGIQGANLLNEQTIASWLPGDNPDLAHKFLTLGVRAGMHWLAGYSVTSSALQQFNLPQTYSEAMRLAADEMEARERAEAENKSLTAQVTKNAPKVQAYEQLINSEGNVEMKDFADALNIKKLGRNKFIELLREHGIFTPDNRGVGCTPYRRYIDAGYFEVNEKSTRIGIVFYTVITPKGQDWMLKQLRKWEILPAAS